MLQLTISAGGNNVGLANILNDYIFRLVTPRCSDMRGNDADHIKQDQ